MSLADDIQEARKAGQSDDTILEALQAYDPSTKDDITGALKAGRKPSEVLDGLAAYDAQYGSKPAKGLVQQVTDPFRYGSAETLHGDAQTLKAVGQPNASDAVERAANFVAPTDYEPAGPAAKKAWDESRYLDLAKLLPKTVAEGLPQLGQAAAGAAIGSLAGPGGATAGWMLGHGASTFGPNAYGSAAVRTGNPNAEPGPLDYGLAAGSSAAEGYLAGKGTQAATSGVLKAGQGLPALALQTLKGAGYDAATSAAATGAHDALINEKVDPSNLGLAAVTGGATGAALRAGKSATDLQVLNRFKDVDPELGARAADRLYATGEKMGTPADDKVAFDAALTNLKAQRNANTPKGQPDATDEIISRVKQTLDDGRQVNPDDLTTLADKFGKDDPFVNAIQDHDTLNRVRSEATDVNGGLYGGIQGSSFGSMLSPQSKIGKLGDVGTALAGITGAHVNVPALHGLSMGINPLVALGAHLGGWVGVKGIGAFRGTDRPISQFAERFRSPDGQAFDPSSLQPSFNDQTSARAAENKAASDGLAQMGRTALIMKNSEALAQKQASQAPFDAIAQNAGFEDAAKAKQALSLDRFSGQMEGVIQKNKRSDAQQQQREQTRAALQELSRGSSADDALAAMRAKQKAQPAEPPIQLQPGERVLTVPGQPQAQSAPKAPLDPHKYITLTDGGEHTVQRTTEGVRNTERYKAGGNQRLADRTTMANAAVAEAPPGSATAIHSIVRDMNKNAKSREAGQALLMRHAKNLSPEVRDAVLKHMNKEEFWLTWAK